MMTQTPVEFGTSTAYDGYVCPTCGYWVTPYENHICPNNMTPIQPPPLVIPTPIPLYWLDPRVEALIHRVDELEKKLKLRGDE